MSNITFNNPLSKEKDMLVINHSESETKTNTVCMVSMTSPNYCIVFLGIVYDKILSAQCSAKIILANYTVTLSKTARYLPTHISVH